VAVDFGSTFTKVCTVDLESGRSLGGAASPTTPDDLRVGLRHALGEVGGARLLEDATVLGCSSAGGGLRVAVAGLEEDLTVRAGRYAAMSAGGRVVRTFSGGLDPAELAAARPDLVMLTGGLDGGDEDCLLGDAEALAASEVRVPVVIAGNAVAADRAARSLARAGIEVRISPNVMPDVGVLNINPARANIREVFVRHVIGGKQVDTSRELRKIVRMATPDAVLLGTEILARSWNCDVVAIDVGGATTDVHSQVQNPVPHQGTRLCLAPEASASRTVEADLGVWSNAETLVAACEREGLLDPQRAATLTARLPREAFNSPGADTFDLELAGLASHLALHRHAGRLRTRLEAGGAVVETEGKDLRSVTAVVGSGGIFRRSDRQAGHEALRAAASGLGGPGRERRLMPSKASTVIDSDYILAAAGLISTIAPSVATELLTTSIPKPRGPAGNA
jgi:uncharacterized protein (TIGR01319 family)